MYLCLEKKKKYKIIDTHDGVISLLTEDEVMEVFNKGLKIENLVYSPVLGLHMAMPQILYVKLDNKIVYKINQSGIAVAKFGQSDSIYLDFPHQELVGIFTLDTTPDIIGAYFLVQKTQLKRDTKVVFWDISDYSQPIRIDRPFIETKGLIIDNSYFHPITHKSQVTETFPQQPVFIGDDTYKRFKNVSTGASYYTRTSNFTYEERSEVFTMENEVLKPVSKLRLTDSNIQLLKMFSTTIVGKILKEYKDLRDILRYKDFDGNDFITETMYCYALEPMLNAQLLKERQQICERTGLYDFNIRLKIKQTQYSIMQTVIQYVAVHWGDKSDRFLVGETDIK